SWLTCWRRVVRMKALTLSLLVFASCSAVPKPRLQSNPACRLTEPPPVPNVDATYQGERGCEEPWIVCLDREQALALEDWVRASRRWMDDAWLRCGPGPEGPPGSVIKWPRGQGVAAVFGAYTAACVAKNEPHGPKQGPPAIARAGAPLEGGGAG